MIITGAMPTLSPPLIGVSHAICAGQRIYKSILPRPWVSGAGQTVLGLSGSDDDCRSAKSNALWSTESGAVRYLRTGSGALSDVAPGDTV